MEFIKSLISVGSNKFNYHFYREDEKKSPIRIFEEDNIFKKFNSYFLSEPTLIIDNIYLGNGNNAANINTLIKYDIDIVINVTQELNNYFEDQFEYHKFELLDEKNNDISNYFETCLKIFQNNEKKNFLIHCFMGSSRSAIIVLLYLTKIKNMTLEDSIKFLKDKRDIVNINVEFIEQLKNFLL